MSQRVSGYDPVPGDLYCTPGWVTEALLGAEKFDGRIFEPACGKGHMLEVLNKHYLAFGNDLSEGDDFLVGSASDGDASGFGAIITNPPYSHGLAERFVRHAINLMEPVQGKVAMLLPHGFDCAKTRRDLFADHRAFKVKYTLTRRIRWENLTQSKNGPSTNHAWYVWDWKNEHGASLGYLP